MSYQRQGLMVLAITVIVAPVVVAIDDHSWIPRGGHYGLNGDICAMTYDPQFSTHYFGGHFTRAGDMEALNIVGWNAVSNSWISLADGVNGHVRAMIADTNGQLYVGGSFTSAGGIPVSFVAKWSPASMVWTNLGAGLNGVVYALALDDAGLLYAGGAFTEAGGISAMHIAYWNPVSQTWMNLGLGVNDDIYALAWHSTNGLYAGGWFTMAGTTGASYVARWDGNEWFALNEGVNDVVSALEIDGAGDLIVAGYFSMAGTTNTRAVAKWNGSSWQAMSLGQQCYALALDYDQDDGMLYAAGWVTCSAGGDSTRIVRWDGSSWTGVATMNGMVTALDAGAGKDLYAGGFFTSVMSNPNCGHIVRIDTNGAVYALGSGMENTVDSIVVATNGTIYVAGWFRQAGHLTNVGYVARWNPTTRDWSELGVGLSDGAYAMAAGTANRLYLGGMFHDNDGDTNCHHISEWNEDTQIWTNLGSGLNRIVYTLATDHDGNLYAGGNFTAAGSIEVQHVAKWNGNNWTNLGAGFSGGGDYYDVYALAVDSSNRVYAGGWFTNSGGVKFANVAMWDPISETWTHLGQGVVDLQEVHALAVDENDHVYAGGCFTNVDGVQVSHIARWDPVAKSWTSLGSGVNCAVKALAFDEKGNLYAGGAFTAAGGQPAYGIAQWDGGIWRALGSGVDGQVLALAADGKGRMYVGGEFRVAGGKLSAYLAELILDSADTDDDGLPDWWEWNYFGGGTNATPGSICSNGVDTVWQTYLADIPPDQSAATLPWGVLQLNAQEQPQFHLDNSSTGRVYCLYATTNLVSNPQTWTPCGAATPGTGAGMTLNLPSETETGTYRFTIQLP